MRFLHAQCKSILILSGGELERAIGDDATVLFKLIVDWQPLLESEQSLVSINSLNKSRKFYLL